MISYIHHTKRDALLRTYMALVWVCRCCFKSKKARGLISGPCLSAKARFLSFICLSGLVTAVAVFRNPNTIPFCLTADLLLNVFSWLLVHLPSTFFLDVLVFFFPRGIHSIINFGSFSSCILLTWPYHWGLFPLYDVYNVRLLFHSHYFLYMFIFYSQYTSKVL